MDTKRQITLKHKAPVVTPEMLKIHRQTVNESCLFLNDLGFEFIPELNQIMIPDVTLAESLGYERPRKIRDLITPFMGAILELGNLEEYVEGKEGRGRKAVGYLLNLEQAFFIITKSETALANRLTMFMVSIVSSFMRGELLPINFDIAVKTQQQLSLAMKRHQEEKQGRREALQFLNSGRSRKYSKR